MANPKVVVTLETTVGIDPIPTDPKGIVRGPTIIVKGTAECVKDTSDGNPDNDVSENVPEAITEVAVRFGQSGGFVKAKPTGPLSKKTNQKTWSTWSTDPLPITGFVGNELEITGRVSASASAGAQTVKAEKPTTVIVTVDRTPPDLRVSTGLEMTKEVVNGQTTFTLKGTAEDPDKLSPVAAVEWMVLGQGQKFTLAKPKAPGNWSEWTADVKVSPAGTYEVSVQARDGEGNVNSQKVTLHAVEKFEPQEPSNVFSQAAYLDDLLHFAGLRMVDAEGKLLTSERFETAFRQRYKNSDLTNPNLRSDLTNPNNRETATASVRQVRVSVEVLRAFLAGIKKSTPLVEEVKYRQAVYGALLRNLGTSFDEIRRSRGDGVARARLADRLGLDRPDRLDQLMLLPGQVPDAKFEQLLEQLFGLQDTTRDPLARGPKPLLLTSQIDRLRAQWQIQDNAARVYTDIPLPIIDPDLLVETDFRTRNRVVDPAFALWDARKGEMTTLLKQIDDLRKSQSTPLAGFDAVVSQKVSKVEDLTALLADYQAGKDIVPRLTGKRLDLAAFLRLMRSRELAAAGTILDADWADVYAIAAEVTKLGRYPVWRTEEQVKALTLGPDFFVLSDLTTPQVDLPEWRATLQARRAWQATLQTRINQQQDVIQALRDVVDAAEAEALPGLRDLLVATAGDAARGLLIDLAGGITQRTTRLAQAIEILQGALFTVRVGAFAQGHPAAGWKLAPSYTEADFDEDWVFWGSHETWQGAMRVFIYPESHLLPTLRPITRYELRLISVPSVDSLLNKGRNLVIVALVGTELRIRIFDGNGNKVIDKAEKELIKGETMTTLKQQLNPFPDESRLSEEQKQKFIGDARSIAGHSPVNEPTNAYLDLIENVRSSVRITPKQARDAAAAYLIQVRKEVLNNTLPQDLKITERMTDKELADRQAMSANLMQDLTDPHQAPSHLKEVFYFVPLLCATQLQRSGEYLAALDWFQTVYAYHLPPGRLTADRLPPNTLPQGKPLPDRRQIYYGLTLEEKIQTEFHRPENWPREGLNPHDIVQVRANALSRFVVISLVRCFEQFADAEFTGDTDESVARARTLYQTALDLLSLAYPVARSTADPSRPSRSTADASRSFGLDPVIDALRLHAESNLRKLRLGRNIAGLERQLSPELAAGTAVAPRQPTPYRYAALIARAKELTQTAAQMEAALLTALEKREAESYNLLKATQDVELAGATVDLRDLQVKAAVAGIPLAAQQKQRAQIQFGHFENLINEGTSELEIVSSVLGGLGSVVTGAPNSAPTTGAAGATAAATGGAGGAGAAISVIGSIFGGFASRKRQEDEWILQRNLANQDIAIAGQQVTIAKDQVAAAKQEQKIAQIQKDHAAATVQFLAGKFTNAELYEFMSEVLDGVYRFFLQQATALAKLAEEQLAFERQEPPQGVIQGDYYAPPEGTTPGNGASDRKGITGSARLLGDIVQLDQHAFLTDQRRLQLTKTLSLARFSPIEFAQFRETGVLVIGTPQSLFDRDFPGHYLRLVKRVRTSVIALISPTDGIHATLSTTGTSRVVIGDDSFRNVVVRRDPESVGLTSPRDATGLFELVPDSQPELLLPFEGSGVDTIWRFELPKAANPFDYSTIADVLLTIEYTALNSFEYRQQVIQTLDPEVSLDRPFSFQQQFPDQWYDLNNPDQAATPMTVRFKTARGDFLPNIDDLKVQQLVLYFAPTNGHPVEIRDARLQFKSQGDQNPVGGSADSIDGIISTRRANGSNWLPITGNKPPIGEWELALPSDETIKNFFRNEKIEDILFVITYSGRTPEWPD